MVRPKAVLENIFRTPVSDFQRIGRIMRLDQNEMTTPLDPNMVRMVLASISPEEIVAYPELEPVYRRLGRHLGVQRGNILLFSGSDPGIKSLFEVYVEPGDEVVTLTPSYGMFFVYGRIYGATTVPVSYQEDFSLLVESVISKINDQTKLLLIANPNHTGTVISESDLRIIIEFAARHQSLVLVDEAYHEFCGETVVPLISQYDNLVVSRTMSKAYGIAALRVGYLISNTENIQNLQKVKATHEITSVSARFAEYLLDHPEVTQNTVKQINAGKDLIYNRSKAAGIQSIPSRSNFVFLKLPRGIDAKESVENLKKQNIYIKGPFGGVPVDGMIRITVGPPEQMNEFMDALESVMNESI